MSKRKCCRTNQGIGTFHIDAAKDNPTTGAPSNIQVLDDSVVLPGGRIGFILTQQRAGIVLRTWKYTSVGGEIWFGTSCANNDGSAATIAANNYRRLSGFRK